MYVVSITHSCNMSLLYMSTTRGLVRERRSAPVHFAPKRAGVCVGGRHVVLQRCLLGKSHATKTAQPLPATVHTILMAAQVAFRSKHG
jgi:hypothetical protein